MPPAFMKISGGRIFWAVVLAALLIRIGFVSLLPLDAPDTADYQSYALGLLNGSGFSADLYRAPLYPAFLAAVYALLGKGFAAVRIIQAALGAITCGLVFLLARRLFDSPRAGILAALAAVSLGARWP